jgi:predicted nucleotide-binding protein
MALSREVNDFDLPSDYSGVIFTSFSQPSTLPVIGELSLSEN